MTRVREHVDARVTPGVALPLILSLIAGVVDVSTFVLFGGIFSAHITGNVVVLGADLALHRPMEAAGIISIPLFIVTTAAVTVAVDRSGAPAWIWVRRLLVVQFVFVAAAGTIAVSTGAKPGSAVGTVAVMLAVAGMATQNSLLHLTFNKTPTTAVMTGNIVAGTVALIGMLVRGRGDEADHAAWNHLWPLIAGFFAGCFFGALIAGVLGMWAWALPVGLCGVAVAVSIVLPRPSEIRAGVAK